MRVAILGARGRMGSFAAALIQAAPDLQLACEVGRGDDLEELLAASGAALGLDLTVAGLGAEHARRMLRAGVRPVVGTSGVTPEELTELDALARELDLGGLVVPNFSLGVHLQKKCAELVARHLDRVEILERHHEDKVDAPSGTALDLARSLRAITGRRPSVHSVRLPGVLADQEVVFGAEGQTLEITHRTFGLEAFGPGILGALRRAPEVHGIEVGLEGVFGADG